MGVSHNLNIVPLLVCLFTLYSFFWDCKNVLKVEKIFNSIQLNNVWHYFSNIKVDITITQENKLFRLMVCAIVFYFLQHTLLNCSLIRFFCVKHMKGLFYIFVYLRCKKSIFKEVVDLVIVLLAT